VTVQDLRLKLVDFGLESERNFYFSASPTAAIVQRTAQNIKATYILAQEMLDDDAHGQELKKLRAGHPNINLEAALYASMWADILTKQTSNVDWDGNLVGFLTRIAQSWSEDAWIVEKYLLPLYDSFINAQPNPRRRVGWENPKDILGMLRNLDQRQPTVNRRYTQELRTKVRYKIGQVFRHKRYQYIGVINGWALRGTNSLPTPHYTAAGETDNVEDGNIADIRGDQSRDGSTFYTCLFVVSFTLYQPGQH
jgi:F-box protein 21